MLLTDHGAERRAYPHIQALLASTGEGLLVVDGPGIVRVMNETAEKFCGCDRGEMQGAPVTELGCDVLVGLVRSVSADGAHESCAREVVDGRTLSYKATPYERDDVTGCAVVIRDDTEIVHQQERAEAILAGASDGLVIFDPDSRITYVNPAASELLGPRADRVVGQLVTLSELLGSDDLSPGEAVPCWEMRECERLECPQHGAKDLRCWLKSGTPGLDGEPARFADKREMCATCEVHATNVKLLGELNPDEIHEVTLSEPEHRVLEVRVNPVVSKAGRHLGCVASLHDVTAQRDIAVMKNEFVSMVSHELRTPLTSIKGYVDLIVDGEAGEINDVQREFLQIVQENSDRLVSFINELLDVSRIESGRVSLRIEPVEIDHVVEDVIETFAAVADQANVELSCDAEENLPRVAADKDRVGQVLMNLVSNAIKYSPDGGTARIETVAQGDDVLVRVTDTGIGIEPEDQEKLFTKFFRVDSSLTREIGGTGLGLSICKSVIELLGGEIGVESVPGEGATFFFTLPAASDDMARTPAVAGPLEVGGKVLVVDRDPEVADLIGTYLEKRGYEVVCAHSAHEALAQAIEHEPKLITLDVMLDDMDGFDLLQSLKDDEHTANIPVVVLSIVCDRGKSMRLGAADYLEKPIDSSRLVGVVDGLVGAVTSPVVLVVDDDKDIVNALSVTLRAKGFAVASAYDGREALQAVEAQRPDLILLDLRMPVMDGYEVIEAIKTDDATEDIPIVVMTAHRIDQERVGVLQFATEQVAKPLSAEEIAEHVERYLGTEE